MGHDTSNIFLLHFRPRLKDPFSLSIHHLGTCSFLCFSIVDRGFALFGVVVVVVCGGGGIAKTVVQFHGSLKHKEFPMFRRPANIAKFMVKRIALLFFVVLAVVCGGGELSKRDFARVPSR